MIKRIISICFLLGWGVLLQGAQPATLTRFLQTPGLEHASVGVSIIRVRDGKEMVAYHPELSLTPASTQKTITTATALRVLGAGFRFPTTVHYTGMVKENGTLAGDLLIVGTGDPTMGSRYSSQAKDAFFQQVIAALKKKGVRRIQGRIIADDTALDTEPIPGGWSWEDMGNYYAAGVYGLNYGDNLYDLTLDTSRKGVQPRVVKTTPEVPGLKIQNHLLAKAANTDSAYLYGAPYSMERALYGAVPQKKATFQVKGDVPNPPLLLATLLQKELQKEGIPVEKGVVTGHQLLAAKQPVPPMASKLTIYWSDPLSAIIRQTNQHSWNLYAEALLRAIAHRQGDGKTASGVRALLDYWKQQGVSTSGLFLQDGSGLSPANRITPAFLTSMLCRMNSDSAFVSSLPLAGKEGTVESFLRDTSLAGKARLKSGYIKQVIAYTGYIDGKERYAVAILVNNGNTSNRNIRQAIQKFLLAQDW